MWFVFLMRGADYERGLSGSSERPHFWTFLFYATKYEGRALSLRPALTHVSAESMYETVEFPVSCSIEKCRELGWGIYQDGAIRIL